MPTTNETTKVDTVSWVESKLSSEILEFGKTAMEEYGNSLESTDPVKIRKIMNVLTACASLLTVETGQLEVLEAKYFSDNRDEFTSDKQTKMAWLLSKEGQRQVEVKSYFKAIEKIISACKTTLRQLELEARSNF